MRRRDGRAGLSVGGRRQSRFPPPGEPPDHALGRSRGKGRRPPALGFGTKLLLATCGRGVALNAVVLAGQAHESTGVEALLDGVRVGRRRRAGAVAGDKGYGLPRVRDAVRRRGMRAAIPRRGVGKGKRRRKRGRPPAFDPELYRRRNVVERCVGWLRQCRCVATRHEKLAVSYLAFVQLAIARRLLRVLFSDRT